MVYETFYLFSQFDLVTAFLKSISYDILANYKKNYTIYFQVNRKI